MTLLSVDRTLEVLDVLIDRGSVGVSELAAKLCVAASTAHRMLDTLQARQYVVQDEESKRYSPGPRMLGLSHEIQLIERSRSLVERLGRLTGMTVHLGVLDGRTVRYLHAWTPDERPAIGSRVGTSMLAHVTAAGKALLSETPQDRILRTFPEPVLPAPTPASISDRRALLAELQTVRRTGYARNLEESERGVLAFANAFSHSSQPVALTVSVWRKHMPISRDSEHEKRIAEALALAATRLERIHSAA